MAIALLCFVTSSLAIPILWCRDFLTSGSFLSSATVRILARETFWKRPCIDSTASFSTSERTSDSRSTTLSTGQCGRQRCFVVNILTRMMNEINIFIESLFIWWSSYKSFWSEWRLFTSLFYKKPDGKFLSHTCTLENSGFVFLY